MPVQGRVALGARRGRRSAGSAVGFAPATMGTRGRRHAHLVGFDPRANFWLGPNDRARLEQLCR